MEFFEIFHTGEEPGTRLNILNDHGRSPEHRKPADLKMYLDDSISEETERNGDANALIQCGCR